MTWTMIWPSTAGPAMAAIVHSVEIVGSVTTHRVPARGLLPAGTGPYHLGHASPLRVNRVGLSMVKSFGEPGDRWSLPRVYAAMLVGALLGGALGYLLDLVIGPLVSQSGWWLVVGFGGGIAAAAAQCVREFATPRDGPVHAPAPPHEQT
ncbi:MAG TPA: hypothetical protein VEQ11_20530 [Chloroflexota bacterium]|nr:hypothetical protein [Chloroflexota bacterium]